MMLIPPPSIYAIFRHFNKWPLLAFLEGQI